MHDRTGPLCVALFAAVAGGCARPTDPCSAVTGTCLTIELTGHLGPVDSVGLTFSGAVSFAKSEALAAEASLPILIGVELPAVSGPLHVAGAAGDAGRQVGAGARDLTLTSGGHLRAALPLESAGDGDLGAAGDSGDLPAPPDLPPTDLRNSDLRRTHLPAIDLLGADLAGLPEISAISPPVAPTSGGTPVTITGDHFAAGATVTINGIDANQVVVTSTSISATAPSSPGTLGKVAVVVTNPDGTSATRDDLFGYYAGNLTFDPAVGLDTQATPFSMAVADLDKDGHTNLLVITQSGYLHVFLGDGTGHFAPRADYATISDAFDVAVGDLDSDGKLDVAVAGSNGLEVYQGNGDGSLALPSPVTTGSTLEGVAIADIDGDHVPDLVVAENDGSSFSYVALLRGNGDFSFQPKSEYATTEAPWPLALADLNGDHFLDVVVPCFNGRAVGVFLNGGNGTLSVRRDLATSGNAIGVALGDFDGNGSIDIAAANFSNMNTKLTVFSNTGTGAFASSVDYTVGHDPYAVAAADFDGDGVLDLVSANSSDDTGSILLGSGKASFADRTTVATGSRPRRVITADFNEDGRPDLVFSNQNGAKLSLLLNTGS